MGINPNWTAEQKQYLKDNWGRLSIKEIAENMGKTINAVKLKARHLGLKDPRKYAEGPSLNQLAKVLNTNKRISGRTDKC